MFLKWSETFENWSLIHLFFINMLFYGVRDISLIGFASILPLINHNIPTHFLKLNLLITLIVWRLINCWKTIVVLIFTQICVICFHPPPQLHNSGLFYKIYLRFLKFELCFADMRTNLKNGVLRKVFLWKIRWAMPAFPSLNNNRIKIRWLHSE